VKKALALCLLAGLLAVPFAAAQDKTEVSLTLEEAVVKALKGNLNLAVEVISPGLADAGLSLAHEAFLPRVDFSINRSSNESPSYWFLQGSGTVVDKMADFGFSASQKIPTGADLNVSLDGYRSETNQAFQLINPRYGSTLRFDFTQPLLRNFGPKVARREILVARNNVAVSENQFRSALMDTVYLVQEAYWNLVYAIENLKVSEQSLQLGRDLLVKTRKEVEVGQTAPIEVLNAEATVAQREADILAAEVLVRRSEDVLRNVVNLSAEEGGPGIRILPADKPSFAPREVSLDEALQTARAKRPDVQVSRTTVESRKIDFSVARNQTLPGLDFKVSYFSPGISGDRILYLNDDPLLGIVIGKEKGSSTGALKDSIKFLYPNWTVGLTLSLPIADTFGRANYAAARLQMEQAEARLKSQEQQVELEVSDAVRSVETDAKRVAAYRIARELAEKRLAAETKKLGVGLTTNYFVLQYQEQLANALSMEIKALVDYNLSLARLERATGTSLEARSISVAEYLR
jgi:outer membrane protein TolC